MDKERLKKEIELMLFEDGVVKVKKLAEKFNVTESSMNVALKKEGYRDLDIFVQLPKNYIRSFENVDEETSYWLGYLQADGCININKSTNKRRWNENIYSNKTRKRTTKV